MALDEVRRLSGQKKGRACRASFGRRRGAGAHALSRPESVAKERGKRAAWRLALFAAQKAR
jgi:hypothetical protein